MKWRDFLYFSKGERRALTVLLCLIASAWLAIVITDHYPVSSHEPITELKSDSFPMVKEVTEIIPDKAQQPKKEKAIIPTEKGKSSVTKTSSPSQWRERSRNSFYPKTEKYPAGTVIELNTADTTMLKKIPGIGSAFSNRIVKYRNLLGGFYSVSQLGEVYGIDAERYESLKGWFSVNPEFIKKRSVNTLSSDSLNKHPYISYRQTRAIMQQRKQKGTLSGWENLILLEEFTEADKERISHYFSFD